MQRFVIWGLTLAIAGGLGGCATAGSGSANADSSWHATGSNTAVSTEAARNQPVLKADTKANFEAVAAAIKQQMGAGGRWQYVNARERDTIDGSFADMTKLYDQYGAVDKMDTNARARLLADQSTINAILTKKDGDRLICTSEVPVGTHFPVKTCRTYSQIQAEQFQAQKSLQDLNQRDSFNKPSGRP